MEISNPLDKESKVITIKMLNKLSENFNKIIIRKYQREVRAKKYNNWTENTLKWFNSKLDEAEQQISELEVKTMNI